MHEYHEVKKRVAEERTKEEGKEILVEVEEQAKAERHVKTPIKLHCCTKK